MRSPKSVSLARHVATLLLALAFVMFGRTRDARADACVWAYPVGAAPSSPSPLADGHAVGGTNLPRYGLHLGSDFWHGGGCADLGTPVYAAADGVVAEIADALGSYLDVVVVRHDDPEIGVVYTMYGHIARAPSLVVGQAVGRRQQLGTIGNVIPFGFSPCHVHFEILSPNAFDKGPFCSGCAAAKINVSPGYDQKRGVTKGTHPTTGDPFLEVTDSIANNRWYVAEPFLARRMDRSCGDGGVEDGGQPRPEQDAAATPAGDPGDREGAAVGDDGRSSGAEPTGADLGHADATGCRASPVGLRGGSLLFLVLIAGAIGAGGRRASRR
jgi:hypothetical protein